MTLVRVRVRVRTLVPWFSPTTKTARGQSVFQSCCSFRRRVRSDSSSRVACFFDIHHPAVARLSCPVHSFIRMPAAAASTARQNTSGRGLPCSLFKTRIKMLAELELSLNQTAHVGLTRQYTAESAPSAEGERFIANDQATPRHRLRLLWVLLLAHAHSSWKAAWALLDKFKFKNPSL